MNIRTALPLAIALALSGPASAKVYKCTDPDTGEVVYSQSQCATDATTIHVGSTQSGAESRDGSLIDAHQALVRAKLKDPGSAEFSAIRRLSSGTSCGLVNAKNSYGGYTGSQLFLVLSAGGTTRVLIGKDVYGTRIQVNGVWVDSNYYADQCLNSGKPVN